MGSPIFDISTFKANVANSGFVQTNKYVVVITPNSKLAGAFINTPDVSQSFKEMGNELQFRCAAASLPGMILRTQDINRMGLGIMEKMPFGAAYTDVDLSFFCDRFGSVYNFWYGWLNFIFASVGKESPRGVADRITSGNGPNGLREYYTTQYKDNYAAIVDIIVFNNYGQEAIEYKLYQAFPVSINDSPISWGDNDNLLKLTVKISFREWAIDDGNVILMPSKNQVSQQPILQGVNSSQFASATFANNISNTSSNTVSNTSSNTVSNTSGNTVMSGLDFSFDTNSGYVPLV